jgi:hypothetical protein
MSFGKLFSSTYTGSMLGAGADISSSGPRPKS